eukprot:m.453303 g.453303  ORF g.453303 m.453303 type:complete len:235 (+) comp21549_c0_seq8:144-848(+)
MEKSGGIVDTGVYSTSLLPVDLWKCFDPSIEQWFNSGMLQMFNFNRDEAGYVFRRLLKEIGVCERSELPSSGEDESLEKTLLVGITCWAIAYNHGVDYNKWTLPSHDEDDQEKWAACALHFSTKLRSTLEASGQSATHVWMVCILIETMAVRAGLGSVDTDLKQCNENYAQALRTAYHDVRLQAVNADVAAIFAEALMQLRPWKLWEKLDDGQVRQCGRVYTCTQRHLYSLSCC